jgi:hypothetical protein
LGHSVRNSNFHPVYVYIFFNSLYILALCFHGKNSPKKFPKNYFIDDWSIIRSIFVSSNRSYLCKPRAFNKLRLHRSRNSVRRRCNKPFICYDATATFRWRLKILLWQARSRNPSFSIQPLNFLNAIFLQLAYFFPKNCLWHMHSGWKREFLSSPIFWLNQFIFKSAFFLHFLFYKVNLYNGIFKKYHFD